MKRFLLNAKTLAVLITVILGCLLFIEATFAQGDDDILSDSKSRVVKRVTKKKRTRTIKKKAPPKKVKLKADEDYVLPLSVVAQLFKVDSFNTNIPINPFVQVPFGTRLRLSVKANQEGYLYVIYQRADTQDGIIIFPSPTINGGNNFVVANKEYTLPQDCTERERAGVNCSLPVLPPVGTELFTIIFSRDRLDELPNDAEAASRVILNPEQIFQFYRESGQRLCESQLKDVPYALKIVNTNLKDNEEIIKTFFLNKIPLR
jgi:hypothetical protein